MQSPSPKEGEGFRVRVHESGMLPTLDRATLYPSLAVLLIFCGDREVYPTPNPSKEGNKIAFSPRLGGIGGLRSELLGLDRFVQALCVFCVYFVCTLCVQSSLWRQIDLV